MIDIYQIDITNYLVFVFVIVVAALFSLSATMTLPCQHMVPKMEKFCWTFDLDKGVKYGAMFLMGCWILYAIIAASCGIGESESLLTKILLIFIII